MFEQGMYLYFFAVYVLLIRHRQICWRTSQGKRDILTLSWRRTLFFRMIGKIMGTMIFCRTTRKIRGFIPIGGISTWKIRMS